MLKHLANTLVAAATLSSVAALGLAACSDVAEAYDCAAICNRYEDCFDEDYDASECASSCEDRADEDDDFAERAANCEACIDDRSCTGSFACVDECAGIVP